MADVDNSAWDGPAAMSRAAASDNPAAAYRAICAGQRAGDTSLQATWALPHHRNPGDPPNAQGTRNSESRLPQTQGLINEQVARRHLDAHMAVIQGQASADDLALLAAEHPEDAPPVEAEAVEAAATGDVVTLDLEMELVELSVPQRRMELRVVPWNTVAVHPLQGPLMFEPGAFDPVNPTDVRLRMDHENPPTGLGTAYRDNGQAGYVAFQLSDTQRAREQLQLVKDGVSRGTSPGYAEVVGKPQIRRIGNQDVKVFGRGAARLRELSTTWLPTFEGDGVVYALHKEAQKGDAPMGETATQEAPAVGAQLGEALPFDYERFAEAMAKANADAGRSDKIDTLLSRMDENIELQRAQITVPQAGEKRKPKLADWVTVTLKRMVGETVSPTELQTLALDDIVTTEQAGLVPNVLLPDYDDIITQNRPFLGSTRQIRPPNTGTSMVLPILITRAVAGTQAGSAEKGALTTTAPVWGTGTFAYKAVFSGADISIQMIQRADASFLDLLTREFGEAYAYDADNKALTALFAGYTDSGSNVRAVNDGGTMDPEDPSFGTAWYNSITNMKLAPDTIWLSSAGVQAFIDAKAPLTNAPLYSQLAAAFTAGAGVGGVLSGLRPVYVPALDAQSVDVLIGPSRGFVWAEDPALRLDVPAPSVAGRDIALVGGIFPAPRYCHAFTKYTVAS